MARIGGGGGRGKKGHILSDYEWLWVTLTKATIFSIQMKHSSILMSDIIDYQKWSQQNYY